MNKLKIQSGEVTDTIRLIILELGDKLEMMYLTIHSKNK